MRQNPLLIKLQQADPTTKLFFSTLVSFGWRIFLVLKLPTLPCLTEEGVKPQLSEIFLFQLITDPPQFDMPQ